MNELNLLNSLLQIDLISFIFSFIMIAFFLISMIELWERLRSKLGIETFASKNKKDTIEALARIEVLETKRKEDVENSIRHDRQIEHSVEVLAGDIADLSIKLDKMTERQKKTKMAELKDKIGHSYRCYHERQQWSEMEKESFQDLLIEYEANGGRNSFVHSIVEPEMHLWKITNHHF